LLRLIEPSDGKILFNGRDITAPDKNELKQFRKEVQLVFQDPYSSLNPRLTIGEAIAEPLKVFKMKRNPAERRKQVEDLMDKVNLPAKYAKRYPHEFSGGQRQRIVIARALALNPHFLVCDESVSALDVSVQAQVLNLLNDLKKDLGLTMLFISHDLSVVRYMSDRIMVMNKGEIIETGNAEAIYRQPQTEYTQKLLAAIPGAI
jgi:peptide/nickel transport system ATP-binding protein